MTMTVSGYLILIRSDLDDFIFPFFPASVLVLNLKFAAHHIFSSRLGNVFRHDHVLQTL